MEDKGYLYHLESAGIAIVVLNRPERLNAISNELGRELNFLFDRIEMDEEVRVVIITGAPRPDGRPCFCAGGDLKDVARDKRTRTLSGQIRTRLMLVEALWKGGGLETMTAIAALCEKLESLGKPVIAAIDGICTGGGLEIALAADIRLVSETAQVSDLHIKNLGTIGGAGSPVRLARIVGSSMARELVFTGDIIDGKLACEIGFATHVYAPERLMGEAKGLASKIAAMRPEAIRLAKANINAAMDMSLRDALRYNYLSNIQLGGSVQEWIERRKKG